MLLVQTGNQFVAVRNKRVSFHYEEKVVHQVVQFKMKGLSPIERAQELANKFTADHGVHNEEQKANIRHAILTGTKWRHIDGKELRKAAQNLHKNLQ